MLEWLESIDYSDPMTIVVYAPVLLGIAYIVFTIWGRMKD